MWIAIEPGEVLASRTQQQSVNGFSNDRFSGIYEAFHILGSPMVSEMGALRAAAPSGAQWRNV
jgi:hypothetical protein